MTGAHVWILVAAVYLGAGNYPAAQVAAIISIVFAMLHDKG